MALKNCNFKIECNKVMIGLMSCNFDLKSYLWFQIKLVLRASSVLQSCRSRIWFQFNVHSTKFNYHFIPLSLTSTKHNTIALIIENNIAWPRNLCYNCYYTYHPRYRYHNYLYFFFTIQFSFRTFKDAFLFWRRYQWLFGPA